MAVMAAYAGELPKSSPSDELEFRAWQERLETAVLAKMRELQPRLAVLADKAMCGCAAADILAALSDFSSPECWSESSPLRLLHTEALGWRWSGTSSAELFFAALDEVEELIVREDHLADDEMLEEWELAFQRARPLLAWLGVAC